jgi:hypothetical protein
MVALASRGLNPTAQSLRPVRGEGLAHRHQRMIELSLEGKVDLDLAKSGLIWRLTW